MQFTRSGMDDAEVWQQTVESLRYNVERDAWGRDINPKMMSRIQRTKTTEIKPYSPHSEY